MSPKMTGFENLLEAVPDALVGIDQKGIIRFVNHQTELLFGYDRDQLLGNPIDTLVPEPLWQIYAERRQDYFADPRTRSTGLELELSGRHHDGTEFPINISLSSIDTGDLLLVITALREVNQRKRAVQSAQHTEAMVEYSDDAIIGLTPEGTITSWNPAAEQMYGYSDKEIMGRSAELLTPHDRTGELNAMMARIKNGHYVEHAETTLVRKDGTAVPVSIAAAPIRDENGTIVGVSAVHRDVTERRQAFENAQRMAAIVQGSDDAIIGSTLEGIITSWNTAAERLFGYSGEEIIGTSVASISPKNRPHEITDILTRIRSGEHIEHLETIRIRKDGRVLPVSLTVSAIREADGAIVGASMISRDMTELRHAAEYSRSLLEAGLDPLVTISPEGKIDDVNEAAVKVTGVPRDQLIGTDFSYYFTDPERAHQGYERVFAQGSVTDYPLTLRHRDGTLTEVLYNASVYRDFNAEVLGVLAVARDVTEQKKATEIAQRLATIVEGSEDAIVGGLLDGTITSWNPAAERMYGHSAEEMIGKTDKIITPRDQAVELKAVLKRVAAGQHVKNLETKRARKDGSVIPVSLTVSPIRGADGAIIGTSVIHRDLTEQQGALALAENMAAIVECSDDPIISRTLDGIITSWNPAAAKMFGYTRQEIVGKSIDLLVPQDLASEMITILAEISAGRAVSDFETTRIRKDGTLFPVSLTVSPIRTESGAVVGASVICRDVTKLKHAAQYARSLIEASLDPLETISPEGKITDVNEAAVKASGVPRHKLIGSDFSGYFTEPDKARQGYQRVFEQGLVTDYPLTLRHQDGTLTDISCNASVYRDAGGNVLGVLAAARDMTQQKKAVQTAQHMATIIEFSDDAIISSTLDGIITGWNKAAERLYGYSREEIIGKPIQPVAPTDRPEEINDILAQIRAGKRVEHFETNRVRKDATVFPVSLTVSPIRDIDGTIVGASVISRAITAQEIDTGERRPFRER